MVAVRLQIINCVGLRKLHMAAQMLCTAGPCAKGRQDKGAGLALPFLVGMWPYLVPEGFPPEFYR